MFTGIVTNIGIIKEIVLLNETVKKDICFHISSDLNINDLKIGASISHNGVCLTVTEILDNSYKVIVSKETLECTNFKDYKLGQELNLERALKVGDELNGHFVLGHVDSVLQIIDIESFEDSYTIKFSYDDSYAKYIVSKGSITIDGVSLTINAVNKKDNNFTVHIIPHTWDNTIFKNYKINDKVNFEVDSLARYILG